MAEMNKITSFKTFTQLRAEESAAKIAEERTAKRGELSAKLAAILDEMDIVSFEELDEETATAFINKAFGVVSEEETLEEGNAFIYAAAKAKAAGKKEFEFNGKTYKVSLKADTGLKESEEVNEAFFKRKDYKKDAVTFFRNKGKGGKALVTRIVKAEDSTFPSPGSDARPDKKNEKEFSNGWSMILVDKFKEMFGEEPKVGQIYDMPANESAVNEAAKIACLECDEVNTAKAWKKNNDVCPSCNSSTNGVAESVVNEAKLNKADTAKIAQKVADIFTQESADEKEFFKYVVNKRVDASSFDLDVEKTAKTPKKLADEPNYFGEYAGGSFIIKDEGDSWGVYNAAMGMASIEKFSKEDLSLVESTEYVSEAVIVTGKRDAQRVMKAYEGFFNAYPALGRNAMGVSHVHHLGAVKMLYRLAMEDANFSREGNATYTEIKGKINPVEVKIADLNNATIKVPVSKLQSLIEQHVNAISGAAKFSGLAIAEGTALYLDSINQPKYAENLLASFNKAFESVEVMEARILEGNAFGSARLKAIAAGKDEFEFDGKTYKVKSADAEDKEAAKDFVGESETLDDYNQALEVAQKYAVPVANAVAMIASVGVAASVALFKKGRKAISAWAEKHLDESFIIEGAKEEQDAMELYTQVAGPKGAYSEDELAKGDMNLFMEIVTAAGYKGSKAKNIADEFRKIATMESVLFEATVEMDAMNPNDKDFLKFLKKHKVSIINKEMDGPGGGQPVITMQGKRKDLEAVLGDCDYGWCDEDLAEYIEESVSVNENKYADAGKLGYNDQFLDRRQSLSKTLSLDLGLNPKHEFGGGDWLGFDYVSLYATGGKKAGTIISDALTGKYTYDELKAAAAKFLGIKESVEVNEAEVKSDDEFKEYAFAVLQKAFGEDFDEAKAQEVVDGLISKHNGDYGAMVGALQSSLG